VPLLGSGRIPHSRRSCPVTATAPPLLPGRRYRAACPAYRSLPSLPERARNFDLSIISWCCFPNNIGKFQ